MMTRRNLFRYFDAEPFRPFRIKITSGETFEIRHPEMMLIESIELLQGAAAPNQSNTESD